MMENRRGNVNISGVIRFSYKLFSSKNDKNIIKLLCLGSEMFPKSHILEEELPGYSTIGKWYEL
jgi:hypothetical protein